MFGRGNCRSFEEGHPFSGHGHFFDKAAAFKEWGWRRHEHWKHNREAFSQDEFNLLVLHLLNQKPSYGYEIIRSIEEITEGAYTPKPETVYPTLTNLEDLGFAQISTEENGKKIYSVSETGKDHLVKNKEALEKVLATLAELKNEISSKTMSEVIKALKNIGFTIFASYKQKAWTNQQLKNLIGILEKAAAEIKGL
jgi:DNA-binding PadR family transcriptional regulator